jgi:hypothetical protein
MTTLSTGAVVNLPPGKVDKDLAASGPGADVAAGVASMQGRRPEHEDAHLIAAPLAGYPGYSFFGVFDGHGGSMAAGYASKHVLPAVLARPEFTAGAESGDPAELRA